MEQFAKPQPNRTDLAITRSTTCQCTVLLSVNQRADSEACFSEYCSGNCTAKRFSKAF